MNVEDLIKKIHQKRPEAEWSILEEQTRFFEKVELKARELEEAGDLDGLERLKQMTNEMSEYFTEQIADVRDGGAGTQSHSLGMGDAHTESPLNRPSINLDEQP